MRLWLVRHGETASNAGGVFQGHLDVALNERGEEQARIVGDALRAVPFCAVYASDLQRAARTAELIIDGRKPITLDHDLREMHYGVLQGTTYSDAATVLAPHGLSDAWLSGDIHRGRQSLPGGESLRQFRHRTARFVRRIDTQHQDNCEADVLIVAHGGELAVLLTVLLKMPARDRFSFRFANCGITRLSRTPQNTTLDLHNLIVWDDAHPFSDRGLAGQLPQRAE